MKANELMIFDLVRRKKDNRTMIVVEVGYDENIGAITPDDRFYGDFEEYHETQVDPIPLTSEILEKNGFERLSNYQWEYRDNSCKIVIRVAPQIEIDGEIIGTPPINIMLEGALFTMNITSDCYVHDLQHIIRFCGINKEFVL